MTQEKHNYLVDQIRKKLRGHEEPYQMGAWEEFQLHRKAKKRTLLTKTVIGVAASLILLLSLNFLINNSGRVNTDPDIAHQQPEIAPPEDSNINPSSPLSEPDSPTVQDKDELLPPNRRGLTDTALGKKSGSTDNGNRVTAIPGSSNFEEIVLSPPGSSKELTDQTIPSTQSNMADIWPVVTSDINPASQKEKKGVILGMAYMPIMNVNRSNARLGMGGGLYTDWKFAGRFAFSSGVLVTKNQLEYDTPEPSPRTDTEDLTSTIMEADLLSLEIPLNLKFYVTDDLSVSAGISSSAFVQEDYNYTYEYQKEVQVLTLMDDDGYRTVTKQVTVRESENESAASFSTVDFAAFYTFSLGYQYDLSKRNTLSLEPYIKLPTGDLTSKKIKYSAGGLQLKVSF